MDLRPGSKCTSKGIQGMNFSAEERAEFIAALSKTADMMELLLRQIDLLIFAQESGRRLADAELKQLHDQQTMWRRDLERLRNRLAILTIAHRGQTRRTYQSCASIYARTARASTRSARPDGTQARAPRLGDSALKTARNAVVRLVDRRAEALEANDAGKGNERNEQRVLDQILTLLIAQERRNGVHHGSTSSVVASAEVGVSEIDILQRSLRVRQQACERADRAA
jgi:hypothetical protein